MKHTKQQKFYIRIGLAVIIGFLIIVAFSGNELVPINESPPIELEFTEFAILISLGVEALPAFLKQFYSAGAIGIKLLMQGFSPILFVFLLAGGQLFGQMVLYGVGIFSKHVHKGSIGDIASRSHFLHQHHFLIYLGVPFASMVGDAVMLYSGHQRINPLKIIPFLYVANVADNAKWVFTQMGNLELSNQFN